MHGSWTAADTEADTGILRYPLVYATALMSSKQTGFRVPGRKPGLRRRATSAFLPEGVFCDVLRKADQAHLHAEHRKDILTEYVLVLSVMHRLGVAVQRHLWIDST